MTHEGSPTSHGHNSNHEELCDVPNTTGNGHNSLAPTWDSFRDAIKEKYYPVGSYEDQCTRWTTLHQERDHTVPYFTNISHTLCTKLGIKEYKRHIFLKYHDYLHRYIQIEMKFLDIASLGTTYRYIVKIEKKFK
jgi:hypothetical protein